MENQPIIIGLDIGGTHSKMAFITPKGQILAATKFPSFAQHSFESFSQRLWSEIAEMEQNVKRPFTFLALGIGAPDANYQKGTMEQASNFNWGTSVPLVATLKQQLDIPVFLTNDANASALGEMYFGTAKGLKNFIVVTLGTGIGSGIVVNGQLLYGSRGFAGELGHTTIKEGGRSCACGKKRLFGNLFFCKWV